MKKFIILIVLALSYFKNIELAPVENVLDGDLFEGDIAGVEYVQSDVDLIIYSVIHFFKIYNLFFCICRI